MEHSGTQELVADEPLPLKWQGRASKNAKTNPMEQFGTSGAAEHDRARAIGICQNKPNGTIWNIGRGRARPGARSEFVKTNPMEQSGTFATRASTQSLYAAVSVVVGLGRSTFPIGRTFLPTNCRRESPRSSRASSIIDWSFLKTSG
jgi:hypothetical protein